MKYFFYIEDSQHIDERKITGDKYPGQTNWQDIFLEIDGQFGTCAFDSNPERGNAVPSRVFSRHELRFEVPGEYFLNTELEELLELLKQSGLLNTLLQSFEEICDGSNYKGSWNEGAISAVQEFIYRNTVETKLQCIELSENAIETCAQCADYLCNGEPNDCVPEDFDEQGLANVGDLNPVFWFCKCCGQLSDIVALFDRV